MRVREDAGIALGLAFAIEAAPTEVGRQPAFRRCTAAP